MPTSGRTLVGPDSEKTADSNNGTITPPVNVAEDEVAVDFARSKPYLAMGLVAFVLRILSSALSLQFSLEVYEDVISTQLEGVLYDDRISGIKSCAVLFCVSLMLIFHSMVKYCFFLYSRREKEIKEIRTHILFYAARSLIYEVVV